MIPYVVSTLLVFACSVCANDEKPWYVIESGQSYVADFVLKTQESMEVSIKTNKATVVYFKTDVTNGKKYKKVRQPVRMSQVGTDKWIGSALGAGIEFQPVKGEIRLAIANLTNETFKVVVVTVEKQ